MYLVHSHHLLDVSNDTAITVPLPCESPLALAAHGPQAALLSPDLEVWVLDHGTWSRAYDLTGYPRPELAALSANGELVALSFKNSSASDPTARPDSLTVLSRGVPVPVDEPDFFSRVTSLACHPDGKSFGLGFLTSQPYGDWGSYGERMFGYLVSTSSGDVLRMEIDTRAHNVEPTFHGAWDADAHVLVTTLEDASEIELWSVDWATRLETSTTMLLVTTPDLTDEVTYDTYTRYDTLPVVSHDGLAAASIRDSELILTLRTHWHDEGPSSFSWGEDLVAVCLALWPEVVLLRKDLGVVRVRCDEILTYAKLLGD